MHFSFADLYERAVRNLLNIRPLFDAPVDLYTPRNADTNPHLHQNQTRSSYKQDRGPQTETHDSDNANLEGQNYRFQNSYQSEGASTGFFAQAISEHAKFSQNRQVHSYHQQRHVYGMNHADSRSSQDNGRNSRTGQIGANKNGVSSATSRGSTTNKDVLNEQREMYDQHTRYWQNAHRHKPSMFDDLRYHAKLVLSGELKTPESEAKGASIQTIVTPAVKREVQESSINESRKNGKTTGAEIESQTDRKLSEKEQLDLIRERIIKENQKLKYRPYSLRSKRNNLKAGKKKSKKTRIRKKSKVKNLWKPSTPQEIFLHQFGLMKKMNDEMNMKEITV